MRFLSIIFALFACLVSFKAWAYDFATEAEAQAMAEKAYAFVQTEGEEKAFASISAGNPQFIDRDLYVFVLDDKGVLKAHGTKPAILGKDLYNLTDATGKKFVQEIIQVKDRTWVQYVWQNPLTSQLHNKNTYIIPFGNKFLGVGAYSAEHANIPEKK